MVHQVVLSKLVQKQIRKLPRHIANKLDVWIASVEKLGLENVMKQPGYHDEPLKGKRRKQRSIRLSIHYRAIYIIKADGNLEFVSVEEVTKHEY